MDATSAVNSPLPEPASLVVGERGDGVNDYRNTRLKERRHLVDQALSGSGGKHDHAVFPAKEPLDRRELTVAELLESEDVLQEYGERPVDVSVMSPSCSVRV